VRCTASGEPWVSGSGDLNSSRNGVRFLLRNLQTAWNQHGVDAFVCEVPDTLAEDLAPLMVNDALRDRRAYWQPALKASIV